MGSPANSRGEPASAAAKLPYATAPAPDGRRRPLLALAHITDVAELAPYALALDAHVHRNAISSRGTEVDGQFLDELLGCHFVSRSAAERRLAGLRDPSLLADFEHDQAGVPSYAAELPSLAEFSLLPLAFDDDRGGPSVTGHELETPARRV
ncbi:hypothetical protein T492DRAFT_955513 [Pavlovales sp. CCMP2436]|nr:hypothetical protein T492DRAFT_955513 [Pavlovales sp. CCMP2436]